MLIPIPASKPTQNRTTGPGPMGGGHTVDGSNEATPTGFYSKSRKFKNSNKNQKLYTIVHLPARIDAILTKIILTLQAASAYTHFRGGVMGSNADFMEKGLEP